MLNKSIAKKKNTYKMCTNGVNTHTHSKHTFITFTL